MDEKQTDVIKARFYRVTASLVTGITATSLEAFGFMRGLRDGRYGGFLQVEGVSVQENGIVPDISLPPYKISPVGLPDPLLNDALLYAFEAGRAYQEYLHAVHELPSFEIPEPWENCEDPTPFHAWLKAGKPRVLATQ